MNLIIREAVLNDVNDLRELYMEHLTKYPPKENQDMEKFTEKYYFI